MQKQPQPNLKTVDPQISKFQCERYPSTKSFHIQLTLIE